MIYRGEKAICTFRPPDRTGTIRVVWEVTNSCNLACEHCCNGAIRAAAAPLQTWQLRLPQAMAAEGVTEVYLSGGEPLLAAGLPQLLGSCLDAGLHPVIASNGILIPQSLHALPEAVPVLISVDWPEADIHDRFRGSIGSHSLAVSAMRALKDHGRAFHVSTVLHEAFQRDPAAVDRMVLIAERSGATAIIFSRQVAVGRSRTIVPPADELVERISSLADSFHGRLWIVYPRLSPKNERDNSLGCCHGAHDLLHISAAGAVGPCSYALKMLPSYEFANIQEHAFAEVVARARASRFRADLLQWRESLDERCTQCRHNERCHRGCPLFAVSGPFVGLDAECPQVCA